MVEMPKRVHKSAAIRGPWFSPGLLIQESSCEYILRQCEDNDANLFSNWNCSVYLNHFGGAFAG
jgi:hypothetical protein